MKATEISLTALDVEWRRLEIIAQNLANAGTVRTADGGGYRPMRLISGPRGDFKALLDPNGQRPGHRIKPQGVAVYSIEPTSTPPRMVYEPKNPQADIDGFVAYSDIDQAEQMTLMIKTSRIYEANIVAMGTARQMYAKALEIGGQR